MDLWNEDPKEVFKVYFPLNSCLQKHFAQGASCWSTVLQSANWSTTTRLTRTTANTWLASRSSYLILKLVLLMPIQMQHLGLDTQYSIFNTITNTPTSRSRRVPSTPRRTVPGYIFNLKAFHLHAQVHQYEKTPCWGADGSIVEYLSLHIWTGGTHGRGEKEQTDRWKAISSQLKRLDCSRIVSCQHQ